jgi:YVTN family beta-propeller protein
MDPLQEGDPRRVGEFTLEGRLGAGGMGRVYLGRSPGGRLVAVKVVHDWYARDREFRVRFAREVAAARRVSGFYTAEVVAADPDAALPWMATRYIDGPSLLQVMQDGGPLPVGRVFEIAAGIAEALAAIHAVGVVHRDLKPSNVLLAADGPHVIDFGIAQAVGAGALTGTGLVVGTAGFMSPEEIQGEPVEAPSDVFALGALIHLAATGRPVFGTGPPAALIHRVLHADPDLTALTHPDLHDLVAACLAKDPRERPTPAQILTDYAHAVRHPGRGDQRSTVVADPADPPTITDHPESPVLPTPGPSPAPGTAECTTGAGSASLTPPDPPTRVRQDKVAPHQHPATDPAPSPANDPFRSASGQKGPVAEALGTGIGRRRVAALGLATVGVLVVIGILLFNRPNGPARATSSAAQGSGRPTLLATIAVGDGPQEVAVSPDGRRAYNADQRSGTVTVIDTSNNTVTKTIPVGIRPVGVAFAPDGSSVYITNEGSGTVSVIDATSEAVKLTIRVGDGSDGVAIDPDGSRAYVTNSSSGTVSVVDTAHGKVISSIGVGKGPDGVAVTPDGRRVYVTNKASGTASVIDTSNEKVIAAIGVGNGPSSVAITPDGRRAYITNNASTTVSVIDTSNDRVTDTINVGIYPAVVAVAPDGGRAFVTNAGLGTVSVIDTRNDHFTDSVRVGDAPIGVAVTPDGHRAYVANLISNTISVIGSGAG